MNPLPPLKPELRDGLPFVYLNVAITADGKIAPANRHFVPFSSKRDEKLLFQLRTRCDAVLAGARTVNLTPVTLGPGEKPYRKMRLENGLSEFNLRVVASGSASIDPRAQVFQHSFSPVIVLVSARAPKSRIARLQKAGAVVKAFGDDEIDFRSAIRWLRRDWKVTRLLCEGGGEINAALLQANLVNEVYVTLCPTLFGGRHAPTLADGLGVAKLADAKMLRLKSAERAGNEMYLVYTVVR